MADLYGSLASDSAWLQPGELADTGPKLIKFTSDGPVKVAVRVGVRFLHHAPKHFHSLSVNGKTSLVERIAAMRCE